MTDSVRPLEIVEWSAVQTAANVRAGSISATEVIEAHLDPLAATNPHVNAITRHDPERARSEASAVDAAIQRGDDVGPLAGVPVTVKDNVDVEGDTTPNGLTFLNVAAATESSPAVTALRAAGAVVLGRTNAPEFSWRWHTDNSLFGPTLNPRSPTRTPGGSSGGAAAALAVGIGCLALGNDAGGSVRWPAVCTGTAALKPTSGRIASHNTTAPGERPLGVDLMATQGAMARTIVDVGLMFGALVAPSWRDPNHIPIPSQFGTPPRRIGVHLGDGAPLHPAIEIALRRAGDALDHAEFDISRPDVPDLATAATVWATLINADFESGARAAMQQHGSASIQLVLAEFARRAHSPDLAGVYAAHATRASQLREWMHIFAEQVDIIVMPAAMEPAWPVGDDEDPARLAEIFAANTPLVAMNALGLPAAAVGVGEVDGVPVGVQVVGPRFAEAAVLEIASVIEGAFLTSEQPDLGTA